MGGTKILSWSQSLSQSLSQWGIIAPRPAGPYPDISLAGKNPMSVALTERPHKSKDNYLLGKKMRSVTLIRSADERVVRGYDQNYNKKQKYLLVLFFMYDSKSFSNIIHLDSLALAGAVGISRAKNQRRWCLFGRKMS